MPSNSEQNPVPKNTSALPAAANSNDLNTDFGAATLEPETRKALATEIEGRTAELKADELNADAILASFKNVEQQRLAQIEPETNYADFLNKVFRNPELHIRNVAQYIVDAMDSYGGHDETILGRKVKVFNFREWPWQPKDVDDRKSLIGQELLTYDFYSLMKQLAKQEFPDRMVVVHGPPGGGKTRFQETINALLEDYSKNNPQGALYRLSWVFPDENSGASKGKLGYLRDVDAPLETLPDGGFRIPASLNTDPIFLLPNERTATAGAGQSLREDLFKRLLDAKKIDKDFNQNYLLLGSLDSTSQTIFDSLLRHYKGDVDKILKEHVRVERWTISGQVGRGLANIAPMTDRRTEVAPAFNEHPFMSERPPQELQATYKSIFSVNGRIQNANRGHVNFSDIFRENQEDRHAGGDLSRLDYLLETIEGGKVHALSHRDPSTCRIENINVLFRADTNDAQIIQKSEGAGWSAFKQRCRFLTAPLIRRYQDEAALDNQHLEKLLTQDRAAAPHAVNTLALFVTATRLLLPQKEHYEALHSDLPAAIESMNCVEKALFLQGFSDKNPEQDMNFMRKRWSTNSLKLMTQFTEAIANEHMKGVGETRFSLYDGGMGISTREVQDILRQIVQIAPKEDYSVIEVIQYLEDKAKGIGGFEYDRKISESRAYYQAQFVQEKLDKNDRRNDEYVIRQANDEALRRVKALFPIPTAAELVEQIKTYAKYKVKDDIDSALGLAKPEDMHFLLKRYMEHVRSFSTRGQFKVRPEYRASQMGTDDKWDERFMRTVEEQLDVSTSKSEEYRKNFLNKIGAWTLVPENKGRNVEAALPEIFADMFKNIENKQRAEQQAKLNEFVEDVKKYSTDPALIENDRTNALVKERFGRYQQAMKVLLARGYPEDSIARHVVWATTN